MVKTSESDVRCGRCARLVPPDQMESRFDEVIAETAPGGPSTPGWAMLADTGGVRCDCRPVPAGARLQAQTALSRASASASIRSSAPVRQRREGIDAVPADGGVPPVEPAPRPGLGSPLAHGFDCGHPAHMAAAHSASTLARRHGSHWRSTGFSTRMIILAVPAFLLRPRPSHRREPDITSCHPCTGPQTKSQV